MLMPSLFDESFAGKVFDDFFNAPFGFHTVDVNEFEYKYLLELELPGFSK